MFQFTETKKDLPPYSKSSFFYHFLILLLLVKSLPIVFIKPSLKQLGCNIHCKRNNKCDDKGIPGHFDYPPFFQRDKSIITSYLY